MRVVDLMNALSCFKGKKMVVLTDSGLRVSGKDIGVPKAAAKSEAKADQAKADKANAPKADKANAPKADKSDQAKSEE